MPGNLHRLALPAASLLLVPMPALAAPEQLVGLVWGLPFAGLLLSIALFPLLADRIWHRRMGVIAALWGLSLLLPWAARFGAGAAFHLAWHAILLEYLPFVALIFALFTVGGGIVVQGGPWGQPAGNTLLLAIGTVLASVMGTTGAAMVLIHPLLRANAHRTRKVHLAVFFILLVGNVGGSLTPLGDPPLFLGFLRGVPFFWPTLHLLAPMAVVAGVLLLVFFLLDSWLARRDPPPPEPRPLRLRGGANIALLGLVVLAVLMQGVWQPGEVALAGTPIGGERLAGMALMLGIGLLSLRLTPRAAREANMFSWAPFAEVAKLFAAIFICMGPMVAILQAGEAGPLGGVLALATGPDGAPLPAAYFWLTGGLSAFLDNAPTYVVFFELAGGDPARMTGELARVLLAISCGAVFMGALTYIGNAPNFMVRAIASRRGVHMPGFLGFMVWSLALMLPPLALVTWLFFL
ncbi:sodium:proton antiporter [Siccirubricoccus sp. KC 17139]|uniref:Sodium:proton antiporter n=1 Tax=Siccirubricoccus soli TaxID=2899147 RepID=A0ABT1D6Z0_9PROT|nr:sodium:proton antiporter [Siccirubricoccus soli]MCO6417693.1 sodium:proton antiporter [Siccirubricoccus soli]MCP2683828.1 sodium:proton antiporter [Siccirubricoccus soli]